jgi:hypothetical protein
LYRCILKVPLPSWPHCCDSLTVWRRVNLCSILLDCTTLPTTHDKGLRRWGSRQHTSGTSPASLQTLDSTEDDEEEEEEELVVEFVSDFKDFAMYVGDGTTGALEAGTAVRPLLHLLIHPVE